MTHAFEHGLAAFGAIVLPFWSRLKYRAAQRRVQLAVRDPRVPLYRKVILTQGLMTAAVIGLWGASGTPAARFGLAAPRSWAGAVAVTAAILVFFGWSTIQMRNRAPDLRAKLRQRGGALLPESPRELRWFAAISLGSGIAEELLYRGFFFFYLRLELPSPNAVALVLITSAIFGGAHLYQGWRGIAATGIAGLLLGSLYALTGTVFVPMIVHSAGNLRAVPVFWPGAAPSPPLDVCRENGTPG